MFLVDLDPEITLFLEIAAALLSRQGCRLSLVLFNRFINDFVDEIK